MIKKTINFTKKGIPVSDFDAVKTIRSFFTGKTKQINICNLTMFNVIRAYIIANDIDINSIRFQNEGLDVRVYSDITFGDEMWSNPGLETNDKAIDFLIGIDDEKWYKTLI
jgi:hypothetical protein